MRLHFALIHSISDRLRLGPKEHDALIARWWCEREGRSDRGNVRRPRQLAKKVRMRGCDVIS